MFHKLDVKSKMFVLSSLPRSSSQKFLHTGLIDVYSLQQHFALCLHIYNHEPIQQGQQCSRQVTENTGIPDSNKI